MSVAMRAMRDQLDDPTLRPVSANTVFCSPVPHGPLEIRVEVLRRGNVASQVRAALSSLTLPGPGLEVTATFARDRDGPDVTDSVMPDVPGPSEAIDLDDDVAGNPHSIAPFFQNFECKLAFGPAWWVPGWTAGPARYIRWIRYQVPQKDSRGMLDPIALPPIADTMPPALIHKLGPDHPRLSAPSLDLTVHFLEDTDSEWLLVSSYARRARAGYATADVEIWSESGALIAFGTQTMILRKRRTR